MFWMILLGLATAMNFYVVWRVASVPLVTNWLPARFIWLAGLFLWLVLMGARYMAQEHPGPLALVWEFTAMSWLGVGFILLSCFLDVDLVTGFGFFMPALAPKLRALALAAGLLLSAVGLVQGLRAPVVSTYQVTLPGLPKALDGTRVAVLSDTHMGTLRGKGWLAERVEQVNRLKPDLVFLVGDIIEGHRDDLRRLVPLLAEFKAPMGRYAVLGNHEFYQGGLMAQRLLERGGVRVLRDRWLQPRPGLVIAGVDDLTIANRLGGQADERVEAALRARPEGALLLLSHTPWGVEKAADSGVDLMLCGHTHAGQIWPFGHLVKRIYPYFQGRYQVGGLTVLVCRGTGLWGPPMRLWQPSELLLVVLKSPEK